MEFNKPSIEQVMLDLGYPESYFAEDEDSNNDIEHYGVKRRSGRYPWGSGEDPYQRSGDFLSRVDELKKQNFSYKDPETGKMYTGDAAIYKSMGLSSTQYRTMYSIARDERRGIEATRARDLRDKGYSLNAIAKEMGYANDSSIRSLLNENTAIKKNQVKETAEFLKKQANEKGMIDVGGNVEYSLNISKEKLEQALVLLEMEGYPVYGGRMPQVSNPKQMTTLKVLCKPGTEHKEIFNYDKIKTIDDYITRDDGKTYEKKFHFPESLDSSRLAIRYKEDGGIDKDGVIELRRGVPDLSLGNSHYSQVRILVDGNKYLKGMAIYSDDLPDGVDVVFNTNKSKSVPKMDVLKNAKTVKIVDPKTGKEKEVIDQDNPFGSAIKPIDQGGQYWYTDSKGKKRLGLINKRADEGDWDEWKDKLPAQFLSKQSEKLAKQQLGLAVKEKTDEFNAINSLTNPTVKKKLLQDFADNCDSAAVHLYAAALPRQKYHVIIPIPKLKDNEIYAPKYNDGEEVALIRYPHGGTFEIPILRVNNKSTEARKIMGPDFKDAVGINSKVAERLSGADFDGDTVMVIPTNNKVRITATDQLEGLKGFDPKMQYGTTKKIEKIYNKDTKQYEDTEVYYNASGKKIKVMNNTQNEMGRISNLITDMTLKGAKPDELAKAVRHSMVVIDAEKHKLDYKQSAIDNDIDTLKSIYQSGGASTLISAAKGETSIPKRQGSPKINIKGRSYYDPSLPEGAYIYKTADDLYYPDRSFNKKTQEYTLRTVDGKLIKYSKNDTQAVDKYTPRLHKDEKTGETYYTDKTGKIKYKSKTRTEPTTNMAATQDARTLISKENTPMEQLYADYANTMKRLANESRRILATTGGIKQDSNAKKVYSNEVKSLEDKLKVALQNKPRERQANAIANSIIKAKEQANPDMTNDEKKKLAQRELSKAREMVGSKRINIEVTPKEWEAIQAGAISETTLKKILNNADMDIIRDYATPKDTKQLSQNKINRIATMRSSGLTINQIANALGISTSTVNKYLK